MSAVDLSDCTLTAYGWRIQQVRDEPAAIRSTMAQLIQNGFVVLRRTSADHHRIATNPLLQLLTDDALHISFHHDKSRGRSCFIFRWDLYTGRASSDHRVDVSAAPHGRRMSADIDGLQNDNRHCWVLWRGPGPDFLYWSLNMASTYVMRISVWQCKVPFQRLCDSVSLINGPTF